MTRPILRRSLIGACAASLLLTAPAAADVRTAVSRDGVQFTLSGTELTVAATAGTPARIREQLQGTGLDAFCVSGLDTQSEDEMPEGGFEFIVLGNRLTPVDGVQRTTLKRDISATVDLCGVQGEQGSDVAVVGFTRAGRRAAAESQEEERPVRREERRLNRALEAAKAAQAANEGRFPTAPRLRRAIVRRTDGEVKVRLARRLSQVDQRGVVYIVGKPTGKRLTLATRTREGGLLEVRVTGRGETHFEQVPAP